jgi:hypothetical protein
MRNICFKRRQNDATVQLVRHVYSADVQRSRTVTVGSLPMDADPTDFHHALRLRSGALLSAEDELSIQNWLALNGDKVAALRRQEVAERIAAKVRAEIEADVVATSAANSATEPVDVMAQAALALEAVTTALPELVAQANVRGEDAWKELRPRYLAINKSWQSLMRTAQSVGVAKKAWRSKRSSEPAVK